METVGVSADRALVIAPAVTQSSWSRTTPPAVVIRSEAPHSRLRRVTGLAEAHDDQGDEPHFAASGAGAARCKKFRYRLWIVPSGGWVGTMTNGAGFALPTAAPSHGGQHRRGSV
jgi:hypothetical protein